MKIEQRTNRTVDEGLALFLERFQPGFPDQALNHIVLASDTSTMFTRTMRFPGPAAAS